MLITISTPRTTTSDFSAYMPAARRVMEGASTYTAEVPPDKAGYRLDRLLAETLPQLSRTRLKALIEAGDVCDGLGAARRDPSARVRAGDAFQVRVPAAPPPLPEAQEMPLTIVYEDEHVIVVDKPAGLVVHPGAGNRDRTLVNALLAYCPRGLSSIGGPLRPGIVHRIDKDTSGLLVVARTDVAHASLARQFAEHSIERAYVAVVAGNPNPPCGRITGRIGRSADDRTRMAVVALGGKTAVTTYETVRRFGTTASQLICRLQTGRTHQIRVHMASIGNPLVGDRVYARGSGRRVGPQIRFERQALHAFLIGFRHPTRAETLRFNSDIPSDINALIRNLETV